MRIHCFTEPESLLKDTVVLSSAESHHLARVLRVEAGQELTLFDGQGTRAEGVVDSVTKKEVTVRITSRETVPPPAVEITLIQAVCKPDRFELILQKATELGVRRIQPVITKNASLPAGKIEKMIERGEAIIRNAAQQCGTAWLPVFHPLRGGTDFFPTLGSNCGAAGDSDPDSGNNCRAGTAKSLPAAAGRSMTIPALQNFDVVFVGSLHPNARPFKECFQTLENIKTAALLIGPEGDFTKEEVDAAVAAGAIPVTFGSQILRTETAAIFGLSVLAYELF
jgi:16S rRNA (uracil1498-N3)-methyltransferase